MRELKISTHQHTEFIEITGDVQSAVTESGIPDGICTVFVPHTTAGITINENADPDVVSDMIGALEKIVPWKSPHYRHGEGNTAAHVKSSLLGHSVQVPVRAGRLQFGTWQGIYFCEFDGPRSRRVWVSVAGI
jgi:secondary thiamine-phosphate synthase enzyme